MRYVRPSLEEVKFIATNVIMASAEETTQVGPVIPGQGGDVTIPDVGGNT